MNSERIGGKVNCQSCGKLNADGAIFCNFCSAKLPGPTDSAQGDSQRRTATYSLVLIATGLILFGISNLSEANFVTTVTWYRVLTWVGVVGTYFVVVGFLSTISKISRRVGPAGPAIATVGFLCWIFAHTFEAIISMTSMYFLTSSERNLDSWAYVIAYVLFGLGVLVSALTRPAQVGISTNFNDIVASTDLKKCPSCAELVQVQAKVCRFCQHTFD